MSFHLAEVLPMQQCETCHAGCCRAFAIPVSGADIVRIIQTEQLPFDKFVSRWPDEKGVIARGLAPHFRFEDEPEIPYVICLNHVKSKQFPGSSKCAFLHEEPLNDDGSFSKVRCLIYSNRPGTCRSFPATINSQNQLDIIDIPEFGRETKEAAYRLCPEPWTVEEVARDGALSDVQNTIEEMRFFQEVASVWNRQLRPWTIFAEFLNVVYAERAAYLKREAG